MTTFSPKAKCDFGRVAKTLAPKSADRGPERGGLIFDKKRSNLEVKRAGEQNHTDIMNFSKNHLNPKGLIFFEINENYKYELNKLAQNYEYNIIEFKLDNHKKNRFLILSKED